MRVKLKPLSNLHTKSVVSFQLPNLALSFVGGPGTISDDFAGRNSNNGERLMASLSGSLPAMY